jgi:hypothetical protein
MTLAVNIAQGGANNVTMRNRIINGAMVIDQRNAGASVTPSTGVTYLLDRWNFYTNVASKLSFQQSTTAPAGFYNSTLITSLSAYSSAAGNRFVYNQIIEGVNTSDLGWGASGAKTVTLSFWVRSSLTGTFSGDINNTAGSASYVFTFSIDSANTWEQKSITIAGPTIGAWNTGTTSGSIVVSFNLGDGSTYLTSTTNTWQSAFYEGATGSVPLVGTSGATFYLTGVQLEAGTTASPFEYRLYGTELALCQRYFEQDYDLGTPSILYGSSDGSSNAVIVSPFKVQKRGTPTMTYYNTSGTSGQWGYSRSGASGNNGANNYSINQWHWGLYLGVGASFATCNISGVWKADAEL